jgi:hypothetical protein
VPTSEPTLPPPDPLSSPIGTFDFDIFDTYPVLSRIFNKLSNCGFTRLVFQNVETGEKIEIPAYCDNRCCNNSGCQKHRLQKYMREHRHQINDINQDMRKPKAWIFTTARKPYPIDRTYCQSRLKKLFNLLSKDKHPKFGSNSKFSVHMEIKPDVESWFLHFHVVSGGITNLRLVRKLWAFVEFFSFEKLVHVPLSPFLIFLISSIEKHFYY